MKSFKTSAASLPEITDRMSGEPAEGTLVDLLVARAGEGSHGPAFRLLDDQGKRSAEMSTVELDRSARAIALALSTALKPGDRALLLYPPGLDFIAAFFGCLYAGVVAVPAYPPDPSRLNRSLERLRVVLVDARPSVVLTTSSGKIAARLILRRAADLQSIPWIATDRLGGAGEAQWRRPDISARTLAFLQYTSGSTGAPKGVMVTHQNLLENLRMIQTVSGTSPESIGVSWLPQYHDMGLVTGILQPLYAGFSVTYLSPVTFLRTPVRWLQAISQNRATHSGAPNFAYDLCVRKVTPEERSQLDLSTWRVAYDAAEIVRPETLDRFTDAFSRCGFRREAFLIGYGLAEATVLVSSSTTELRAAVHAIDPAELLRGRVRVVAASEGLGVVGCGRSPSPGQSIRIVDPATRAPCDPGRVGEIWVAGPGVAAGYWNRPEETRETFDARLANDGAGPYLRTGDLGFVLDDQLHIAGRIKDLIIIRGANHHPEDIEHTIAGCHPAIRPGCCAAFSVDVAGEERLVVAAEIRGSRPSRKIPKLIRLARRSLGRIIGLRRNSGELPHEDGAKIAAAIRHAVARDHDPPVFDIVLVGPGALPKTSSGKIQRHACRRGYLEGRLEDVLGRFPLGAEEPADQASRSAGTSISRNTADLTGETGTQQIERAVCQAVGELARVPPESIRREQRLVADLGLDSLTRTELYFRLGKMFPSLDEADPSWQAEDLTIGAVIDYVSGLPVKELQTDSTEGDPAAPSEAEHDIEAFPEVRELERRIAEAEEAGLGAPYFDVHERLVRGTTLISGREYVCYSSYNYLGLSGDDAVNDAVIAAVRRFGTSASASRLVAGESPVHRELESELARFLGCDDAVVMVGGYVTNLSAIGHMFGPGDLIVYDQLAHKSIQEGARLSGARVRTFPHNDPAALDSILQSTRSTARRVLIAVEGVYSMGGDIAPVPALIEVKVRHKALLYVDEAHSLGVLGGTGRGVGEYFQVDRKDVDFWMGTLSKSLASCGGYIAGSRSLVRYLKYTNPGFVYSVGLPPASAAAALAALRRMQEAPELVARLQANSRLFLRLCKERGIDTGGSRDTPVIPCMVREPVAALRLAQALFQRGISVQPMVSPAVPPKEECLRFLITAMHTEMQLGSTADALAEEMVKLRL